MNIISVREMKAQWSEIEKKVKQGETFQVVNRGKPTVKIVPADPQKLLKWPDHLKTAIPAKGHTGEATVKTDRNRHCDLP